MNIVNMFFPEQIIAVFLMAMVMFVLGVGGGALVVYRSLFKGESGIAWGTTVALIAVVASYATYLQTMEIFNHNFNLAQDPGMQRAYQVLDVEPRPMYDSPMVYTYGSDTPITRAEHERQLAVSAMTSPGDPE